MTMSHRHLRAVSAAAALVLSAVSSHAATVWTATATKGVPVTSLLSATDLGVLPASQPLTVRLGLQVQNKAALLQLVKNVNDPANSMYGQYLTPSQFSTLFAPSSSQINTVVSYLQSAGFSNIVVEPNHLLISADGTAAQASAAFNTKLEQVYQFNQNAFINTTAAQVPSSLSGIVSAVLGLNTVGKMKPPTVKPSASTLPQYLVSYTPKQFQHIYSADTTAAASNVMIAIMAEGDMTGVLKDLRTAETAFGLPRVNYQVKQVGLPSTDTSGADEWDMDTQYSSGMAGTLRNLYIYTTTSLSDSDLALEFSRWATDNLAKGASASLGECEAFPYVDGSMTVDDMIFLEAAAQGQTFFASSGDTGSFCPLPVAGVNGVPAGAPLVSYPAASPYVVGVGGTTLLTDASGNYSSETSWYAGGGGLSQFEGAPYWQTAAVAALSKTNTRGVPDIALDADPNSGALVYVNGVAEGVGGTSLSSPLALGVWARALQNNPKLGFASPRLYSLYTAGTVTGTYPKGGFHDITVGSNGLYTALPGYDLNTGLGTPIVSQITADLAK